MKILSDKNQLNKNLKSDLAVIYVIWLTSSIYFLPKKCREIILNYLCIKQILKKIHMYIELEFLQKTIIKRNFALQSKTSNIFKSDLKLDQEVVFKLICSQWVK